MESMMIKLLFYGIFDFKGEQSPFMFTFQIDSHVDDIFVHPFEGKKDDVFSGSPTGSHCSGRVRGEYNSRIGTLNLVKGIEKGDATGIKLKLKQNNDREWQGSWSTEDCQNTGNVMGILKESQGEVFITV